MLIRSFPRRAVARPGSARIVRSNCGLQPSITTSAAFTPRRFSSRRTSRETAAGRRGRRAVSTRCAEGARVTQAMKRVGIRGGTSEVVDGFARVSSLSERKIPERIAMPRVP